MTTTPAKTYHHGDLPSVLLDAVGQIVAERGPQGVSMREAARRAGVSHSAPAHHFGDKQGMLAAYAQQGFELFGKALQAAVDTAGPSISEQLRAAGLAYVTFGQTNASHFEVMFRSGVEKGAYPECDATADAAFGVLAGSVSQLLEQDQVPDVDERYLAAFFWSLVHGLTTLWVEGSLSQYFGDHTLDELAEHVLDIPFDEMD